MRNYAHPRDPSRGIQLRMAREAAGISRARLGLALAAYTNHPWNPRKAATKIGTWENGRGYFSPNRLELLRALITTLAAEDARNTGQDPHGPGNGATPAETAATSRTAAPSGIADNGTVSR